MARNLYRFYLYAVYIALLSFAAVATGRLLNTLLLFTPLRNQGDSPPDSATVVQSVVFALVSLLIAGALAGLHYWLIRRDQRSQPEAATSAIRSFFLNITEGICVSLAVPIFGFPLYYTIGTSTRYGNLVSAIAFALPTLLLAGLLELERRRTRLTSGPALAFQQLHFYGVQLVLLVTLTYAWMSMFSPLIDTLFFARAATLEACRVGDYSAYCPNYNVFGILVALLWFIAFWVGYGWRTRDDKSPLLRLILHFLSLAYGVGWGLYGIYRGLEVLLAWLFGSPFAFHDVLGNGARYDFVSPILYGILVVGVYHLWLRRASLLGLIERSVQYLAEFSILAVLAGGLFWWGCGYALYNALRTLVPVPAGPDLQAWIESLSFVLTGVGYIALHIYLMLQNSKDPDVVAGPLRGFVLALLGSGILSLAIGGATALYAWMTALFGSPISNWQQNAQIGLSGFVVGVLVVGIYLWTALRGDLLSGIGKLRPTPPGEPPVEAATIEEVLDAFKAGTVTRDEAAARIRSFSVQANPVAEAQPNPGEGTQPDVVKEAQTGTVEIHKNA